MKDTEVIIVQAFMAALCQQRKPLSHDIQVQLAEIGQSLETRVSKLVTLAKKTPALTNLYYNAFDLLTEQAAQRGMGMDFLPGDATGEKVGIGMDNITPDVSKDIKDINQLLAAIEARFDRRSEVLRAPDSVQAAQEIFGQLNS